MFYTYILRSKKDGQFYTGSTRDLRKRFKQHNDNKVFSTKSRGPFELIYYEACLNEEDGRMREKYLKSGIGKRYLKNRLKRFLSPPGFTLLEILAVVTIMTLSVLLVAPVFSNRNEQKIAEQTFVRMEEIRKAILGTTSERIRGDVRFMGYAPDLGALPDLVDDNGQIAGEDGQPRGLWTRDIMGTPEDESDDLPERALYSPGVIKCLDKGRACCGKEQAIFPGWNGLYLRPPRGGRLTDKWGNPYLFENTGKEFIIKSLGADGREGGKGHNQDIVLVIREDDWLSPVAGYISPYVVYHSEKDLAIEGFPGPFRASDDGLKVKVHIYYRPRPDYVPDENIRYVADGCYGKWVEADRDGYFCFDGDKKVPVGTERMLTVTQSVIRTAYNRKFAFSQPYKVPVEPGINWLGNMGSIP